MVPAVHQPLDSPVFPTAGPGSGERALMRAVLEDAIHCMAAETGPPAERLQLATRARAWVVAEDVGWPFSFTNLCDALGFSPETLRARLLATAPTLPLDDDGTDVEAAGRSQRRMPAGLEGDVNDMIRAGQPLRAVAQRFGISVSKVSTLSGGLSSRMKVERDEQIRALRRQGWTHRAIATHVGLSCIRVTRICAGRDRADGDRTAA